MDGQNEKNKGGMGAARILILIVAICVFCYSGYQLITIFGGYKAANDEYNSLADAYTRPAGGGAPGEGGTAAGAEESGDSKEPGSAGISENGGEDAKGATGTSSASDTVPDSTSSPAKDGKGGRKEEQEEEEEMLVEDAEPPLEVNWEELKNVNTEVVGWLYVDGLTNISYPICRAEDNDFYLHQTFRKQYLFAGSIFEDYHNHPDFADPNSIVYGHNMKNGSMFGMLKYLNDQTKYEEHPYFWILTPEGNYRYKIFAIFTTAVDSETYTLYSQNGPEFLKWEERMQELSHVKNDVPLSRNDKTVILSTCTSDSEIRCVVIGKCVSSDRPKRKQATGLTTVYASETD